MAPPKKYHWYKRNPEDALLGMQGLSLEQRGAYGTLLDLIYLKSDRLEDDEEVILRFMGCNARKWKRLKSELLACGKICVQNGYIRNNRASFDIVSRKQSPNIDETLSKDSSNIAPQSNENNGVGGGKARHYPESRIQSPDIDISTRSGFLNNWGRDKVDSLLTDATRDEARSMAPGRLHTLIDTYADWAPGSKNPPGTKAALQKHFLSFVRTDTKNKR